MNDPDRNSSASVRMRPRLGKRQRRRRRNRLLVLFSPVVLLLSPVLVPIYLFLRWRRGVTVSMADVAGSLSDVPPPARDPAAEAEIDALPDTFALCRILGNDLVPRHASGQTQENLRFILENEQDLPGCRKLWLLNRIFDPEKEAALIALLDAHGQSYERIPFDADELQRQGYDFTTFDDPMLFADGRWEALPEGERFQMLVQTYRARNNYLIHNNGARNAALEYCLRHAKWALPFDGNCFFSREAWDSFVKDVAPQRDRRYLIVPMARVLDNAALLDGEAPDPTEEPQIAFRRDAPLRFDPAHPYGRRPKVELFLHLGVKGPWSKWPVQPFDVPPRRVSPEGHRVGRAGWVARLFSGKAVLETDVADRGLVRGEAICATIDMLEARPVSAALSAGTPLYYRDGALAEATAADTAAILAAAQEALGRGPFSVVEKSDLPPSGDPHDYYHPAPYWWPDPESPDGLPFVQRDGERRPGTELYGPESDRFDRTRLQRLFDDTTALALGARLTGRSDFRAHAERLLETWFLHPDTRMNPHLDYAQVRRGHDGDRGQARGIIETKDFYFLLDAVRLLDTPEISKGLSDWCKAFNRWLLESPQGGKERRAANNHGTCYDLQTSAMAAFLGDVAALQQINLRAQARLLGSVEADGTQPHELTRTLTQHYCVFNLQSWVNLFDLLEGAGLRPWESAAGERLISGLRRTLSDSANGWQHAQVEPFDAARLTPLEAAMRRRTGESIGVMRDAPARFFAHDGVAPFWRLGRSFASEPGIRDPARHEA